LSTWRRIQRGIRKKTFPQSHPHAREKKRGGKRLSVLGEEGGENWRGLREEGHPFLKRGKEGGPRDDKGKKKREKVLGDQCAKN